MNAKNLAHLCLISFALCCLSACSKPNPEAEAVKIVMVAHPTQNQQQSHSFAGEVVAKQQTALAFRVGGQITERYVDVGDRVKVGQVLAKLDVQDAVLHLNAARAQLEQAQSAHKIAELEYKRFSQLLPEHAVSRSQFDGVKNQYQAAIAQLKQAQANLSVAQNQTQYNQLIATKNGVVTERNIEIGQVIAAGQPAYQIAMDGDREVIIGVSEQMIQQIKPQQQAWISMWSAPEQRYAAYVREIAPAADQTRTFMVKVALKEQASIQLGQSARVFFQTEQQPSLKVPLPSVSAVDNKAYVWVLKADHTLQRLWVTPLEYQRDGVLIQSRLTPQQWVVIGGVHLLREGQKIRPIDHENRPVTISKHP
ncbi:MAG: efflux RND transporter periplasmic adaptor subunit [Acinetobacter sp.]|nr:MAG: efflux RND transporter periplasmic adaptor subunit [Acinetobacter sp.]